jgi:hypothetical protein
VLVKVERRNRRGKYIALAKDPEFLSLFRLRKRLILKV